MAMIYVFIEGKEGCSEYMFWKQISKYIYADKLCIIGCAGIRKVHSCLEAHKLGKDDIGLVVIDTPIDNSAINADVDDVINFVQRHKNYAVIDTICFEDTILRFRYYSEWLYTTEYRKSEIKSCSCYDYLQEYLNNNDWRKSVKLCKLINDKYNIGELTVNKLYRHNISQENVAHIILSLQTAGYNYKSGLTVSKDIFGNCWYCDCSEQNICKLYYRDGRTDKFKPVKNISSNINTCGLKNNKKTGAEKIKILYKHSPIHDKLMRAREELIQNGFVVARYLV